MLMLMSDSSKLNVNSIMEEGTDLSSNVQTARSRSVQSAFYSNSGLVNQCHLHLLALK